jgi:mannitol-specific phosphotransferase system IIBC component
LTLFAKWNTPTIPPSGGGDGGGFGGVMLAIGIGGGGLVGALVVFVGFKVLISAHKKKKRALKAKAKTAVDNARSSMTDALEQVTKSKSYTDDTEQQQIAMAALAAASKKMAEANTLVKKYKKEEKADE